MLSFTISNSRFQDGVMYNIFYVCLLISLIISTYVLIMVVFLGNKKYMNIFNTWQFPVLFAVFLDLIFQNKSH